MWFKKCNLIIENCHTGLGDVVCLTPVIRDLKKNYPKIEIDVRCYPWFSGVWERNPYLSSVQFVKGGYGVKCLLAPPYPPRHHLMAHFYEFLEKELNISIPMSVWRPDLHVVVTEAQNMVCDLGLHDPYWVINAGGKYDMTVKWWNPDFYQEVVDYFLGKITFVQIGQKECWHPELKNVINLIGHTENVRKLICLIHQSSGVVCPVTGIMHVAASFMKPCVVVAGGYETPVRNFYPDQRYLSTFGCLKCSYDCVLPRCTRIKDSMIERNKVTCPKGVETGHEYEHLAEPLKVPACMMMIRPQDVIRAVESYYEGGRLSN